MQIDLQKYLSLFILFLITTGIVFAQEEDSHHIELEQVGRAEHAAGESTLHYTVFKEGTPLYVVNHDLVYDLPMPELRVFNNSHSVLINSFDGALTFYDADGDQRLKTKISKEIGVRYERSIISVVDGDQLVIALSQPDMKDVLFQIYNSTGTVINAWRLEQDFVNGLSFSISKGIISASVYSRQSGALTRSVVFMGNNGENLSSISANFTRGEFISGGRYFSGHTNRAYFLYNLDDFKIVYHQLALPFEIVIAAQFHERNITVVTTPNPILTEGKWLYQNPSFKVLNTDGQLLNSWKRNSAPFSAFRIETEGKKINFITDEEVIGIN